MLIVSTVNYYSIHTTSLLETEVLRKVRFLVPAQNASISPPIGPILGQFGINIMDYVFATHLFKQNFAVV